MAENIFEGCVQVKEGFAGAKTSTTSHRVFDTLKKAQTRRVNGVLDHF